LEIIGGKALKNTYTRRYEKQEFEEISSELITSLAKDFKKVGMPLFYHQKETFGDVDIVVSMEGCKYNMKDYITAIYYVNDNDGDTYIFNEKYEQRTYKELTVKKVVSPKKGRMVLFKGNHLHSGNYPIQDKPRIVINFNFAHYKDK
jgi:hypothetical protein